VREGCVGFSENEAHARSRLISLTDSGQALLASLEANEARVAQDIMPHISESEIASAASTLAKVRKALAPRRERQGPLRAEQSELKGKQPKTRKKSPKPEETQVSHETIEPEPAEFPVSLL
jgi:hypothetical protein